MSSNDVLATAVTVEEVWKLYIAFHRRGAGSVPGQSMLYYELALGQVFLRILRFCHVSIIPSMLYAYSFITDAV